MENKIREIVADHLDVSVDEVLVSSTVLDLDLDDLDLSEIAMVIEDEFDIEIQDDELEGVNKVNDLVNLVKEHI